MTVHEYGLSFEMEHLFAEIGGKKLVLDTIHRHNREYGTTIIMTSSELEELRSICDRVAIIQEGRVAGILPPTADRAEFGMLLLGASKVSEKEVAS